MVHIKKKKKVFKKGKEIRGRSRVRTDHLQGTSRSFSREQSWALSESLH